MQDATRVKKYTEKGKRVEAEQSDGIGMEMAHGHGTIWKWFL